MSEEPRSTRGGSDLSEGLPTLVSIVTILGSIGLVGSIYLNALVFRIWGINFFEVASPTDLMISGANVISICVMMLLIVLFSSYPMYLIADKRFKSPKIQKINVNPIIFDIAPLIYICVVLLPSILSVLFPEYVPDFLKVFLVHDAPIWYFMIFFILTVLFYFYFSVASGGHRSTFFQTVEKKARSWQIGLGLLFLSITVFACVFALMAKPKWEVIEVKESCERRLIVLWVGSDVVLSRCDDAHSKIVDTEGYVVIPREGLRFSSIQK